MILFFFGIALLIAGYFIYGNFVEKVLGPDDRPTPAVQCGDGVDFIVLPQWKNMLIQLLNIAGIGPVIGVILGIQFGSIVFLLIPFGNILAGAVHDYVSGMMSIRNNGSNLPKLIEKYLGPKVYFCFTWFVAVVLLLVVTVFINVPAKLMSGFFPAFPMAFWICVIFVFLYYILATLLPIDQIIGRFYPIFGFMLLVGTAALFFVLLWHGNQDPAHFMIESPAFREGMFKNPIIPCLFVCIACGLISGFHSTQSPIVARTMASEREARANFYGMMIVEGIIAMIWAGAGMAIYNLKPELMGTNPNSVLQEIVKYFLGSGLGSVTIIAVIVLAITSGDTALRSLRLSLSESLHISQVKIKNRLIVVFPLFLCISALLWWSNTEPTTFNVLWHYFAWANQVLAVFTLLAGTVWLFSQRKNAWITLFPALFMAFVVSTYILWVSVDKDNTYGLDLSLNLSYTIAACIALYLGIWAFFRGKREQKRCQQQDETIENREKTVSDQSHIA